MKVLLVSEGMHEHADPIWGQPDDHGALEILVTRLLGQGVELESRKPSDRNFRRTRVHGKGQAYEKIVMAFLIEADRRGFDALIFLIDEDGRHERRAAMDAAQASGRATLPRACGVAIRTFDAWMLADERALAATLNVNVDAQSDPEELKEPKELCRRLRDGSGRGLRLRDVYATCAERADLQVLKRRCPQGFAPFAERVETLVTVNT